MKFLKKDPLDSSVQRLAENELFEIVTQEIMNEEVIAGVWGRAFSDTEGDFNKSKALYIKCRVQDLKDKSLVFQKMDKSVDSQKPKATASSKDSKRTILKEEDAAKAKTTFENFFFILIAIILPWFSLIRLQKYALGLIAIILQLSLIGWPIATILALWAGARYKPPESK